MARRSKTDIYDADDYTGSDCGFSSGLVGLRVFLARLVMTDDVLKKRVASSFYPYHPDKKLAWINHTGALERTVVQNWPHHGLMLQ